MGWKRAVKDSVGVGHDPTDPTGRTAPDSAIRVAAIHDPEGNVLVTMQAAGVVPGWEYWPMISPWRWDPTPATPWVVNLGGADAEASYLRGDDGNIGRLNASADGELYFVGLVPQEYWQTLAGPDDYASAAGWYHFAATLSGGSPPSFGPARSSAAA